MRIGILGCLLGLLLSVSMVSAQITEPFPDSFGLFFDDDFTHYVWEGPPGFWSVHMVIHLPTMKAISGFEIAFALNEGAGAIVGAEFVVPARDFDSRPNYFDAVFVDPIPATAGVFGDVVYIGELLLFAFGSPTEIYAGPIDDPTVPLGIGCLDAYATSGGPSESAFVELQFINNPDGNWVDENGWTIYPLAVINPNHHWDGKFTSEGATWSAVKFTYR